MSSPTPGPTPGPRLAARAVIVEDGRLLLVNAVADPKATLWCAPGGGVETGASLPDTLIREVHEETGLVIEVGAPCLINEFHAPERGFHQVEVFFRCQIASGALIAGLARSRRHRDAPPLGQPGRDGRAAHQARQACACRL